MKWNPVTLKRLRRFRRRKRAFGSLCLLLVLFGLSLASELLCNDRPLYVRYAGRSFFPTFHYYPEDLFLGSGQQTRPDYKAVCRDPRFCADPANFMVFAPVPFGPHETIDPDSLRGDERVTVAFAPAPRVGNVNVRDDLTIADSVECGWFFRTNDAGVADLALDAHWPLTAPLREGIRRRFANHESEAVVGRLSHRSAPERRARVSLSEYRPRARPPRTVRLTFREPEEAPRAAATAAFGRDLRPVSEPPLWLALDAQQRSNVLDRVRECFEASVSPWSITVGGSAYAVTARRNDVQWPHAPVRGHWLGIDSAGRDVLVRLLYGLRISLSFALLLVIASMAVGVLVGALQGYYGGKVDITVQRLIEIWAAVPFLYVMILVGSVYGRGFGLLLFCYGIFNWIGISYYMRAEFLRLRGLPFVDSARCMGLPARRIIAVHILPNALNPVITFFPFSLVGAVGLLAALDYLGFGLPPPTPSWGEMLHQAQQFRWAWWLSLYPSLALFVVILLGVFIGEGIRDAYDPRPYSRMR